MFWLNRWAIYQLHWSILILIPIILRGNRCRRSVFCFLNFSALTKMNKYTCKSHWWIHTISLGYTHVNLNSPSIGWENYDLFYSHWYNVQKMIKIGKNWVKRDWYYQVLNRSLIKFSLWAISHSMFFAFSGFSLINRDKFPKNSSCNSLSTFPDENVKFPPRYWLVIGKLMLSSLFLITCYELEWFILFHQYCWRGLSIQPLFGAPKVTMELTQAHSF